MNKMTFVGALLASVLGSMFASAPAAAQQHIPGVVFMDIPWPAHDYDRSGFAGRGHYRGGGFRHQPRYGGYGHGGHYGHHGGPAPRRVCSQSINQWGGIHTHCHTYY